MRAKLIVPLLALVLSAASVPTCGDESPIDLPSQLPSQFPTELPSGLPTQLPTELPTIALPTQLPTELPPIPLPTQLPTQLPSIPLPGGDETTPDAVPTGTTTAPPVTAPPPSTVSPSAAVPTSAAAAPSVDPQPVDAGVPWWGWLLIAALALAVVLAIVVLARRGRGDREAVTRADGRLAWVLGEVDEPLLTWRAGQLALGVQDQDTTSETARRWASVDQRLTTAVDELLALESGARRGDVREAAADLRRAVDAYRGSMNAVVRAHMTSDPQRVATATQGFVLDSDLLDRSRQRLRDTVGLPPRR